MNRRQIKNFVRQTLLEVVDYPCEVEGKLLSKKIGYSGVERDVVFEGTLDQVNTFANEKEFKYYTTEDSFGGGYFEDSNGLLYEFHPNPEFYGEMMEVNSSAYESLQRISGLSDRVLSEIDEQLVTNLTEFIANDRELYEGRALPILTNLKERRASGLFDERNAIRLWSVLVQEGMRKYSSEIGDITEIGEMEQNNVAKNLDKFYHKHHENLFEGCDGDDTTEDEVGGPDKKGVRQFGGPLVVNVPVGTVRANNSLFY